jgi:hypothetical protein
VTTRTTFAKQGRVRARTNAKAAGVLLAASVLTLLIFGSGKAALAFLVASGIFAGIGLIEFLSASHNERSR